MLEIKFIIKNACIVKRDLEQRGEKEKISWIDEIADMHSEIKRLKSEAEALRKKRNEVSESINKAKKENRDIKKLLAEASQIPEQIEKKERLLKELEEKTRYYLMRIPNILHESVPIGKDNSENVEIRRWGSPKKFDFELLPHGELAEKLNIADFKTAAKVCGAGFVYLKNELALLDLAIQRFAIDFLVKKGLSLIEPPFMLGREAYEGVTSLEDFENVMYKVENENLYMIATAEHPLVAMHKDEIIDTNKLPLKYVGVSPCFRKEIGSHGVDTRGFFRMHQFNKVEQVVFCKPEDSWRIFEELQRNSEEMLQLLEIPYRVVNICSGDIGMIAAKKYDIEAWFPREQKYAEITSCSNCTSYQAVRLNIRYRMSDGATGFVHTLNNTGLATSRTMRAILENYQNRDYSVTIPRVLVPYMNGIKKIKLKR